MSDQVFWMLISIAGGAASGAIGATWANRCFWRNNGYCPTCDRLRAVEGR